MSANLMLGLQLMGYGLAGVFVVLGLFIALIRVLVTAFPYKDENLDR